MKTLPQVITLLLVGLLATSLGAQVFRGLDRKVEEERIQKAKNSAESAEATAKRLAAEKAAAATALAEKKRIEAEKAAAEAERIKRREDRLKFIMDTLDGAAKEGKALSKKFKDDVLNRLPKGTASYIADYLEAQVLYATGQRSAAESKYKSFKSATPPDVTSDRLPTAAYNVVDNIRRAYPLQRYYQLDAIRSFDLNFDKWDSVKDVRAKADIAKNRAKRAVASIVSDTERKIGYVSAAVEERSNEMDTWANSIEGEWAKIWKARAMMIRSPEDPTLQFAFAEIAAETDKALLNIEAIALMKDFLATFPDRPEVLNGRAATLLSNCYLRLYDFESALDVLTKARAYCARGPRTRNITRDLDKLITSVAKDRDEFKLAFSKEK